MSQNKKNNSKLFRKKDVILFIIFLLSFLFIFKDFFFTNSVFYERDSTTIEIPQRILCAKLLKEGNFALWTDSHGNGQPFFANIKNTVFYPSTTFYLFLPFFLAFKLHYFFHVVLAWIGIYYLCKSYSLSKEASFFGATIFIFSGIFLSSFEFYNHVAALCWMPWILFVLHRYPKNFFPKLILLSFLWALLILAGTPYVIVMTFIFGLAQSILLLEKRKKRIFLLIFSLLLSFFICAVQLIPSIELLTNSDRESVQTSIWSLEIIQLFNLVFPDFLGNDRTPGHNDYWGSHLFDKGYPLYYSLYFSFGVFILFFLGFKKPLDKRHYVLIVTSLIFFLLALGKYFPLFFLLKLIPPFSTIRYPVKYLMGALFSLAIVSAIGLDNVFTLKKFKRQHILFILYLSFLLLILYIVFRNLLLDSLTSFFVINNEKSLSALGNSFKQGFFLFAVCSIIIFLAFISYSKNKIFTWIFMLVIIFHLGIMNRYINPVVPILFFDKPPSLKSQKTPLKTYREDYSPYNLRKDVGSSFKYHNYLRQSLYPFSGLGDDIQYLYNRDFYGLYNSEYNEIIEHIKHCQKEEMLKILTESGCNYYISHHPLPNISSQVKNIEGYSVYFQEISEKSESAYLVYNSIKAESIEEKVKIFINKDFNPSQTAIVETDLNLKYDPSYKKRGRIIIIKESQGRGKYLITASQKAILIFPGNYRPGWKAWIDNEKTALFKVNLTSKGILIPAGKHEVELKYFPKSFIYGLIISAFSLLMIIIASITYKK